MHSPGALTTQMKTWLEENGPLEAIVAPNLFHHLYLHDTAKAFPAATLHGPLGLEKKLSELTEDFNRFPQALIGVRVSERRPIESLPTMQSAIREVEAKLADRGRVLIRYSGTEPLARIMVEGESEEGVSEMAEHLADELKRALVA